MMEGMRHRSTKHGDLLLHTYDLTDQASRLAAKKPVTRHQKSRHTLVCAALHARGAHTR